MLCPGRGAWGYRGIVGFYKGSQNSPILFFPFAIFVAHSLLAIGMSLGRSFLWGSV